MHIVYMNTQGFTFLHLQCKEETHWILLMVIMMRMFIKNIIHSELRKYIITLLHKHITFYYMIPQFLTPPFILINLIKLQKLLE